MREMTRTLDHPRLEPRSIQHILRGLWWRARTRFRLLGGSATTRQRRLFYVLEMDAIPRLTLDPRLEFRETGPNGRLANEKRSDHFAEAPGVESGHVVGLTEGKQVYRMSYVRGDGYRLRGVPGAWRPRGRVVLLHDGYTEPAFRNRGVHSAALRWILDRERSGGVTQAVCVVHADNFVGRRTVTRLGFQCIGEIE